MYGSLELYPRFRLPLRKGKHLDGLLSESDAPGSDVHLLPDVDLDIDKQQLDKEK